MQNRRGFLATTALFSSAASLGLVPGRAATQNLAVASENELIAKMNPSIWVAWARGAFPDAQGAADKNKSGYLQVGFQYHTFNLVPYALVHQSTHFMDGACSIAEYAFAHQHPDGSFDYRESNGVESSGAAFNPAAPASSLTLFYYDLGHSLLVLNNDQWYLKSATCAPFRARLNRLMPKIDLSLSWLLTQQSLLATDHAASNRTLSHGLAYYLVGKALGRSDAMDVGARIVSGALDNVSGGVFPEAGGFDSSYQGINILQCQWTALHSGGPLQARLWKAIRSGIQRENAALLPSGEISIAGNTRISNMGESYFGHHKSVNSVQVLLAYAYYGVMASDPSGLDAATRIQQFYQLPTQ